MVISIENGNKLIQKITKDVAQAHQRMLRLYDLIHGFYNSKSRQLASCISEICCLVKHMFKHNVSLIQGKEHLRLSKKEVEDLKNSLLRKQRRLNS